MPDLATIGLRLVETFRNTTGQELPHVEVVQIGGERDRGDDILSVTDPTFPRFRQGERYVLFLKRSTTGDGTYIMATDTPDSALLLDADATVKPRGRSQLARSLTRYSREDLLNRFRTMADRGRQ